MKRFLIIVALSLVVLGARAEGPDDQYVRIYNLIQEADKLNSNDQPSEALSKYLQAQTTLQRFQKGYPDWNNNVVNFRLNYMADKIAALSARVPAPAAPAPKAAAKPGEPASASPAQPAAPNDWENQLNTLKDQVHQLQADKTVLESKLKEALSVQPATVDPRELAKAETKVQDLLKENDLLKVSLAQEQAKPIAAPDTKALDEAQQALAEANRKLAEQAKAADALALEKTTLQTKLDSLAATSASAADLEAAKQALAEANRKLAEQTQAANALALEKTTLQTKLDSLAASSSNAADVEAAKQALEEANRKLAEQSRLATELAGEKEALQARVKTLNTDVEAAAALRAENQLLKQQVAALQSAPPPASKAEEANLQLSQAQAQVAALQSDKDVLQQEKIALEDRVKQLAATPAADARAADIARIKELEQERDVLKKSLAIANKELYSRKGRAAAARLANLENQLATLRARLQVYEARQVPYTAEELALFKLPEPKLAQPARKASKTSVRELPPGSVALVAEAQRHYANRQYDQAEEKYLQVLQQDRNNVPTLANLAAIELDLAHLDAAETNITQAIALAPDDAFSHFVLGRLRLAQKRYDEAVDALSLAAKLDPRDAQIQNFLGLTLSEKGLRGPAETALRKAIQLDPSYGSAHNNLAVIYITQQPPLLELARWHYQKALAAGHPRNPDLEQMIEARQSAASGK